MYVYCCVKLGFLRTRSGARARLLVGRWVVVVHVHEQVLLIRRRQGLATLLAAEHLLLSLELRQVHQVHWRRHAEVVVALHDRPACKTKLFLTLTLSPCLVKHVTCKDQGSTSRDSTEDWIFEQPKRLTVKGHSIKKRNMSSGKSLCFCTLTAKSQFQKYSVKSSCFR